MPLSIGLILVFMLGWACGMAWIRATRADRADKLCATIATLRAELAERRQADLRWLMEDDGA